MKDESWSQYQRMNWLKEGEQYTIYLDKQPEEVRYKGRAYMQLMTDQGKITMFNNVFLMIAEAVNKLPDETEELIIVWTGEKINYQAGLNQPEELDEGIAKN